MHLHSKVERYGQYVGHNICSDSLIWAAHDAAACSVPCVLLVLTASQQAPNR